MTLFLSILGNEIFLKVTVTNSNVLDEIGRIRGVWGVQSNQEAGIRILCRYCILIIIANYVLEIIYCQEALLAYIQQFKYRIKRQPLFLNRIYEIQANLLVALLDVKVYCQ